ncbi:MAG TPA: hypothetical protein VGI74_05675 [Streptosporangiaceae bacterium]|jgi:hypothetical protein
MDHSRLLGSLRCAALAAPGLRCTWAGMSVLRGCHWNSLPISMTADGMTRIQ